MAKSKAVYSYLVKPHYHQHHTINATNNEAFLGYKHTVTGHTFYEECLTGEIIQDSFPASRIVSHHFSPPASYRCA